MLGLMGKLGHAWGGAWVGDVGGPGGGGLNTWMLELWGGGRRIGELGPGHWGSSDVVMMR